MSKKYIVARNKLIHFAERYANDQEGKIPQPMQSREAWSASWNQIFLGKMDQMAREQGLIK